ncbi:MAG: hypothetical protein QOF24_390 [Verrucomicrobiota bacterium]|jgi:hypothetical protein
MSTEKKRLTVSEVFLAGGLPKYTYVPRTSRKLEERLGHAKDNLCKIATVTGATKSGKTVLVKKVFGNEPMVWIDGGHVKTAKDFWEIAADQLETPSEVERSTTKEAGTEIAGEVSAEGNILVVKGGGKVGATRGRKTSTEERQKRISLTPWNVIKELQKARMPVIIDDFHYIPRTLQGEITRTLKPLVFNGVPVIYLAIPHRRYDAVKVEREMNGRIEHVEVPTWAPSELAEIAQLGFPVLRVTPNPGTSARLAREAQGSPHLMQEFCRSICFLSGFREAPDVARTINPNFNYETIYRNVAKEMGKSMYEKLARGPRTSTDRKARLLRNGKTADIYKVVLLALAHLKPDVTTIEYEKLRSAIRDVLQDDLPQAHEVSRVLEQMAKVSAMEESSVPVIDYEKDERKLHITDPFFAFFLRWGSDLMA